jgi:hypothetical protein
MRKRAIDRMNRRYEHFCAKGTWRSRTSPKLAKVLAVSSRDPLRRSALTVWVAIV